MAYPYQRSNFWDTVAQQRALGRRLSPNQTQAALTGERAGELQAYYDQSDRNRLRRLQEEQLALQQEAQGSLDAYRSDQTDIARENLRLQGEESQANRGFQTQQAQAADASARNQAILGYTGLGLGALRYGASAGEGWRMNPQTRAAEYQQPYWQRAINRIFGPSETGGPAIINAPSGYNNYIDYTNLNANDYGAIMDGMNYDQAIDPSIYGDAGMYDYGALEDFDWGSFFTDISGT